MKDPIRVPGSAVARQPACREPFVTAPGSYSAMFLSLLGGVCLVAREKMRTLSLDAKTSGFFGEEGSDSSDGPGRRAVICGLAAYLGAKIRRCHSNLATLSCPFCTTRGTSVWLHLSDLWELTSRSSSILTILHVLDNKREQCSVILVN